MTAMTMGVGNRILKEGLPKKRSLNKYQIAKSKSL